MSSNDESESKQVPGKTLESLRELKRERESRGEKLGPMLESRLGMLEAEQAGTLSMWVPKKLPLSSLEFLRDLKKLRDSQGCEMNPTLLRRLNTLEDQALRAVGPETDKQDEASQHEALLREEVARREAAMSMRRPEAFPALDVKYPKLAGYLNKGLD